MVGKAPQTKAPKTPDPKSSAAEAKGERGYERSTIEFPYGDLDDAIGIVDAIHKNAGTGCSVDQLAAFVDQSSSSGAFRLRLSTTRMFGLIETEKGTVALTGLGRQIVDSNQRASAAAEAFLKVPLYEAIFQNYKGHMLPPAAALQREMISLGVAPKQAQRARQAFERSAEQSGFSNQGKERLVQPIVRNQIPADPPLRRDQRRNGGGGNDGGDGDDGDPGAIHPAIAGLLKTLPTPSSVWPETERKKWLTAVENIFSLVYRDGEREKGRP